MDRETLFPAEELTLDKVGTAPFTGASTGERLLTQRPDLYRITVQLLGQGTGIREIKRLTGLHHRTIEAVMIREGSTIDTHRKELGARALKVAAMGVERLEEIIADGNIKPGELSMAVGILIDKGQVLTGGVTARVERIEQAQIAAGLDAFLDSLPEADAEVIEVEDAGISLVLENVSPIAAASDVTGLVLEPDPVCQIVPGEINIQTSPSNGSLDVLDSINTVEPETATKSATRKAKKGGSPSSAKSTSKSTSAPSVLPANDTAAPVPSRRGGGGRRKRAA